MSESTVPTLTERMAGYSAYHLDPRNQFTHLFGVPMVFYSPLIALGWLRWELAGVSISLGIIVFALVMLWYFKLDWKLASVFLVVSLPFVYGAEVASQLPFYTSLAVFLSIKLVGWIIQLVGHAFEGRRPALADNLIQSLMGPLFVLCEILFAMGFRHDLKEAVEARLREIRPAGEPQPA